MTGAWMVYAVVLSALSGCAAAAAEVALRLWRHEARWVWAASMVSSVAVPVAALLGLPGLVSAASDLRVLARLPGLSGVAALPPIAIEPSTSALDSYLIGAWVVIALALVGRTAAAWRTLESRRRAWKAAMVDGVPVLLSLDAGPAVVGVRRPQMVLPRWVLSLDPSLRTLILRHEREHVAWRDPMLLSAGLAMVLIAPWNPALWWQLWRLRAATELDCDRRVLRAHPDARRYGTLLLTVAGRTDRRALLAPALTEANTLLSRRIRLMRARPPRHRVVRTLTLGVAAAVVAVVACQVTAPTGPAAPPAPPPLAIEPGDAPPPPPPSATQVMFEYQVDEPVLPAPGSGTPRYPEVLRRAGVEGEVLAQFVVDTTGRAESESLEILRSSHHLFVQSVTNALPQMRFVPAEIGGHKVRQLVQQPFTFTVRR